MLLVKLKGIKTGPEGERWVKIGDGIKPKSPNRDLNDSAPCSTSNCETRDPETIAVRKIIRPNIIYFRNSIFEICDVVTEIIRLNQGGHRWHISIRMMTKEKTHVHLYRLQVIPK